MALNAGLQVVVSLIESQALPLAGPFLVSELNTINSTLGAGLTDAEINDTASASVKLTVALLNYAIAHAAAATPPAKPVATPIAVPVKKDVTVNVN